jgi:hypothetical protein
MGTKGQIGNTISYAPAPANNVVSTNIPIYNNSKIGETRDEWMEKLKTTEWYRLHYTK